MTLNIARIRAIPVNVPYRHPPVMSAGASKYSTRTVIIVDTSAGISGVGEASYGFPAGIIEQEFAPAITGLDALDHALLRRHCLPEKFDFGTPSLKMRLAAWGGIEIALWDILGKHAGIPVYRLLGGAFRRRAPFVAYSYADVDPEGSPKLMADRAMSAVEESGASIFEFKVGVHPVEVEIEVIRSVHAALQGRAEIAVDANMGMSLGSARRFLSAVGPVLENCEEPVASLRDMDLLAREFGVNISTHCSDLDTIMHYKDISGVVPTLDVAGGIGAVRRLSEALASLGRRVWLRSHAEAGIAWAAIVHLGISLPGLSRPAQSLVDLIEDDLILGERWSVREGGVMPPERPGLGVELDLEAVLRYHELYRSIGEVHVFPPTPRRYGEHM